jgi:hypothetical protein
MVSLRLPYENERKPPSPRRSPQSKWGAWLALLPPAGEAGALDLPLFWPAHDLALLDGCSTRRISDLNAEVPRAL